MTSKCYIEPDYIASDADDQLPVISAIGRGPRGHGVTTSVVKQDETCFKFDVVDDVTEEAIMHSPNLHAGKISVVASDEKPIPGENTYMDVVITREGNQDRYRIDLPAGTPAETIWMSDIYSEWNKWHVYEIDRNSLITDNDKWPTMPDPRVNDVVLVYLRNVPGAGDAMSLGIGRIRAINCDLAITTVLTMAKLGGTLNMYPIPYSMIDALD